jgi:hypothetical protein
MSTEITASKRSYVKRQRKFTLQERNSIIKSVKEIGVVATADKFNTLYIRVADICDKSRISVKRGRRPLIKAA